MLLLLDSDFPVILYTEMIWTLIINCSELSTLIIYWPSVMVLCFG